MRHAQGRCRIPIKQRIQHRLGCFTTLFQDGKMLEQQGQLDLGFQDIGLASLARAKLRVRDLKKLSEQLHLFMMNLDRLLRKKQIVVGLLQAGYQFPLLHTDRLLSHVCRTAGDFTLEPEFAGEWKTLRETEDRVVRLRGLEGLRDIPQLEGQNWVIQ